MKLIHTFIGALAASFLASCATSPTGSVDTKTDAVLTAMATKLAAAKTLRVRTTRTASPGFTVGLKVAESATGDIVVRRPDKLVARMQTNDGARTIGFDGSNVTVIDLAAGTHSTVKSQGDIDHAVLGIQDIYGVAPPIAELLANRPRALLLDGVKSGKHAGIENISGVACDHLVFTQDRFSWQLWVATGDKLPRRIKFTYPNGEGGQPLTMTATIAKWQLDAPVSDADLRVKAPTNSRAVDMIPIHP